MQTGARYQAVLELVQKIFEGETPADVVINDYMRQRKYIGSKDRRFINDTVWNLIRNKMKLEFDAKSAFFDENNVDHWRRILMLYIKNYTSDKIEEVFDGGQYSPSPLTQEEIKWINTENEEPYPDYVEAEFPKWAFEKVKDIEFLKALNKPASADFRINVKNRDMVIENMQKEGLEVYPTPHSPIGIRSNQRISLGNCQAYQNGEIEVQDEASQIAAIMVDAKPSHKIMDYCCGAGGKSLAIGYLLNNQGNILAHDVSAKRLEAIKPRMQRLGIKNVDLLELLATSDRNYDRFIIDAPCSGSGTWRRSPDAKFRMTEKYLKALNKTQRELLDLGYEKTKVGGWVVYITCSIFKDENENIIEKFVKETPGARLINLNELWAKKIKTPYPCASNEYLRMSPLTTGTDGFFLAIIEKSK